MPRVPHGFTGKANSVRFQDCLPADRRRELDWHCIAEGRHRRNGLPPTRATPPAVIRCGTAGHRIRTRRTSARTVCLPMPQRVIDVPVPKIFDDRSGSRDSPKGRRLSTAMVAAELLNAGACEFDAEGPANSRAGKPVPRVDIFCFFFGFFFFFIVIFHSGQR